MDFIDHEHVVAVSFLLGFVPKLDYLAVMSELQGMRKPLTPATYVGVP